MACSTSICRQSPKQALIDDLSLDYNNSLSLQVYFSFKGANTHFLSLKVFAHHVQQNDVNHPVNTETLNLWHIDKFTYWMYWIKGVLIYYWHLFELNDSNQTGLLSAGCAAISQWSRGEERKKKCAHTRVEGVMNSGWPLYCLQQVCEMETLSLYTAHKETVTTAHTHIFQATATPVTHHYCCGNDNSRYFIDLVSNKLKYETVPCSIS